MQRVVTLYGSTVGKKVMMALSGIVLFGFVLVHMIGNLKMLQGPDGQGVLAMDAYAGYLREIAYPLLPHEGVLWLTRLVLLAALVIHVVAALQLSSRSRAARAEGYRKVEDQSFTFASRTMRWGGIIIGLFVIYHILHFTTGQAHADFVPGAVHRNYVLAFQSPLVFGVYLLAQIALCLHLYHGVWSVFQTLGANHPRFNRLRRPFATGYALVVFVGFMIPPVLVLAGVIT